MKKQKQNKTKKQKNKKKRKNGLITYITYSFIDDKTKKALK